MEFRQIGRTRPVGVNRKITRSGMDTGHGGRRANCYHMLKQIGFWCFGRKPRDPDEIEQLAGRLWAGPVSAGDVQFAHWRSGAD